MNKQCTNCGAIKDKYEFRLKNLNKPLRGRLAWCRECKRNYDRIKIAEKRKNKNNE